MAVNIILAAILFTLMCIIGGDRGLKAYFSLICNLLAFIFAIIAITNGVNILIITFVACLFISAINLFLVNGFNKKTKAALYSILIVVAILIVFSVLAVMLSHIQGFTTEQCEGLMIYDMQIQVSYEQLAVCVMVISLIGALIDAAIAISSAMYEVTVVNPHISKKELFEAGIRMGQDILSTNTNTLYLGFIGGNLAFCIWLKVYQFSIGHLANYKLFVEELLSLIISGLGCILVIPIAAAICTRIMHTEENSLENKM